jgi:hypothetical protein
MDRSNNTKESDQFNGEKNDYSINESSEDVPFLFQRDYGSTKCMNKQYFSYIVVVCFIDGGNRNTQRKPQPCHKSDKLNHIMLYRAHLA